MNLMADRKKPGMAFWATVVVVVAVLYPASTGPLVWLDAHQLLPPWTRGPVDFFYAPLEMLGDSSQLFRRAVSEYWKLWGRDGGVKNAIPG
jgi:hypothetical protein